MNTLMSQMTLFIKVALVALVLSWGTAVLADTTINAAADSCQTLSVSTTAKQVASGQSCWSATATVEKGNQFTLRLSYENSGSETAQNVRLKLAPKNSGTVTQQVFTATITADNAPTRTQSIVVNANESLRFIHNDEVFWFPNNGGNAFGIPFGQNTDAIFSANGLLLGDIAPGKDKRGSVTVVYQAYDQNTQNLPGATTNQPIVGTSPVASVSRTSATFSGYLDPKGLSAQSYFEFGTTLDVNEKTNSVTRTQAGFVSRTVSGLTAGTRYYVRNCAETTAGKKCGVTTSFVTKTTAGSATTSSNTNNSDEPVIEFFEILVPVPSTFVSLGIQNGVSAMQTGDVITYEVTYKNTSKRTLKDGVLYVELPEDLQYLDATRGDYSAVDHAISHEFGTIGINETGTIFVTMQLPALEDDRIPVIAMAQLVHQNPDNGAREGATAYDVDTRYHTLAEERAEALAASTLGALGGGGTLIAVLLVILAIVLMMYYLQISGYLKPTNARYQYVHVPVPVPVKTQEEKILEEQEIEHPPALLDEIYQGHLGS